MRQVRTPRDELAVIAAAIKRAERLVQGLRGHPELRLALGEELRTVKAAFRDLVEQLQLKALEM